MYQACVRATPYLPNHTLLDFETEKDREDFCKGEISFWYVYVEDIEFGYGPSGISWSKGGAWAQQSEAEEVVVDEGERW